jgi:hypothetical protein
MQRDLDEQFSILNAWITDTATFEPNVHNGKMNGLYENCEW